MRKSPTARCSPPHSMVRAPHLLSPLPTVTTEFTTAAPSLNIATSIMGHLSCRHCHLETQEPLYLDIDHGLEIQYQGTSRFAAATTILGQDCFHQGTPVRAWKSIKMPTVLVTTEFFLLGMLLAIILLQRLERTRLSSGP